MNDDGGAELSTQLDLHERRDVWHDDRDGNAQITAVVGQCQRVVTGTGRYYPSRRLSRLIIHTHTHTHNTTQQISSVFDVAFIE